MDSSARITGVFSGYAVILSRHDARRLARDRSAIAAGTAGEARRCRPGAGVLALIRHLPEETTIDLSRLPPVSSGAVPEHPFSLMLTDPLLAGLGQEEDSAFLGQARLIPASDLPGLEERFGWHRNQGVIDAALGSRSPVHHSQLPHTEAVSEISLRLYPTEAAARKAGLHLSRFEGERLSTLLYSLLPEGEKKAVYLLSSSSRLTVAERRWATEHRAAITKLGRFPVGGNFMPLQTRMVRPQKNRNARGSVEPPEPAR